MTNFYTPKQAAKICQVAVTTIYSWLDKGILEKKQIEKGGKIYILRNSIPTFLRKNKLKLNKDD